LNQYEDAIFFNKLLINHLNDCFDAYLGQATIFHNLDDRKNIKITIYNIKRFLEKSTYQLNRVNELLE
jgi:hypothetical protein